MSRVVEVVEPQLSYRVLGDQQLLSLVEMLVVASQLLSRVLEPILIVDQYYLALLKLVNITFHSCEFFSLLISKKLVAGTSAKDKQNVHFLNIHISSSQKRKKYYYLQKYQKYHNVVLLLQQKHAMLRFA